MKAQLGNWSEVNATQDNNISWTIRRLIRISSHTFWLVADATFTSRNVQRSGVACSSRSAREFRQGGGCCLTISFLFLLRKPHASQGKMVGHPLRQRLSNFSSLRHTDKEWLWLWHTQGRNEIRWRPGQEASLVPPCSNLRSWEENALYWIKYLWHCWDFPAPPTVIRRPENSAPLSAPGHTYLMKAKSYFSRTLQRKLLWRRI